MMKIERDAFKETRGNGADNDSLLSSTAKAKLVIVAPKGFAIGRSSTVGCRSVAAIVRDRAHKQSDVSLFENS